MNDTTYEPLADEAIELYWLCHSFNALPQVGGIMDQDYLTMWLLKEVAIAVNKKEERDSKSGGRR